ncbi:MULTISPECIES: YlaF family protein [unclassified Bacillus (in: firmicutes)]|uniref:YlaF family protein n=1 Tax=unclassified Bacillus (in: firmicutes) TaxID=185979 RepID=UPI00227F915A|nr:YlaF family protein [Bacillus sp. S20C3]MCY8202602.1 YlaF family protein [Bacillus sp. N12A5]MCY8290530.1 YlaF family protein [Bacillus sp. N13C7]MCY8639674.1 YlaF family protein [Bacillus sp. S17B2]MCY8719878.1 YlaF family protein [Bacillus sp. S10C12M]MCY9145786.1 YlaF family protein [Bacillus sp. T9C1]
MKKLNWLFLLFAFAAVFSIMLIGVFIAEKSALGIIASIILVCAVMGGGFTLKKKMREQGLLD